MVQTGWLSTHAWVVTAGLFVLQQWPQARAHPLCLSFTAPLYGDAAPEYSFCTSLNGNPDGGCCTQEQEAALKAKYDQVIAEAAGAVSGECAQLLQEVTCGSCHPWAVHLFEELGPTLGPQDGMMLCGGFCGEYVTACGAALQLPADLCDQRSRSPAPYYCYPFAVEVPAIADPDRVVQPAFPGLTFPGSVTSMQLVPGEDTWWILDQLGVVWAFPNTPAATNMTLVLDISSKVLFNGEMGLLGLALHPNFARNRAFYLNYISLDTATTIARFTWVPGDAAATAESEAVVVTWPQPEGNHNGGWIQFDTVGVDADAPMHHFYIGTGDGGGANDLHGVDGNAQSLTTPLGGILRMSISQAQAVSPDLPLYGIPADNPLVNATPTGEAASNVQALYAWGLRNPWQCSFDRETGQLWCGDVGQDRVEEVNIIRAGGNYGWRRLEGTRCNREAPNFSGACDDAGFVPPAYQFCHPDFQEKPAADEAEESAAVCKGQKVTGRSITGGVVYRGKQFSATLGGRYLFADFENYLLAAVGFDTVTETWSVETILADATNGLGQISSFAQDSDGEVYLVSYHPPNVYHLPCFDCAETSSGDSSLSTAAVAAIATAAAVAVIAAACLVAWRCRKRSPAADKPETAPPSVAELHNRCTKQDVSYAARVSHVLV